MAERVVTLTADEAQAYTEAVRAGGTFRLVRDGWTVFGHSITDKTYKTEQPPVEFVQACAPCETCDDTQDHPVLFDGERLHVPACPDCRIELVGPCPTCRGWTRYEGDDKVCRTCDQSGTVTLGHAYAVGQPLPIVVTPPHHRLGWPKHTFIGIDGLRLTLWTYAAPSTWSQADITDLLAHYGPPESLVGKWAIQLAVTT